MRQFRATLSLATIAAAALILAGSAQASVLYDSPSAGFAVGYNYISFGGWAEDSFTLGAPAAVVGAQFDSWTVQGDKVTSVDWSILDSNRVAVAMGTAAVSSAHFAVNLAGFDIDFDQFSIPTLSLASGDYWLRLTNATDEQGNGAGWDVTVGSPSQGLNADGSNLPNTFKIFGADPDRGGLPAGAVPEPASWALMIGGFGLAGASLRRRRSAVAA
ncbi:PEPxxWA-CTERM sorting domain-containing protein [Phenylobacterium sp.]|jgi:hypothetical protein|uniref:PEPxxWA-CTERM sorting domain-containing protein n=1 Tax=Phenylobacterium sp. TaxID=1871053 RepID=UPI002E30185F|nr:PEPxxWA-CTERM sorting domain-containing protein [Phenylobacterium sp.]HEX4712353.1 PEPxxWA-CTERM sorting domain-containing protein [Phenylobacterium sp.]